MKGLAWPTVALKDLSMSIYGTLRWFGIKRFGDRQIVEVLAQGVPPHIQDVGPSWDFLPPPVDADGELMRAVFFVEPGDEKGTERCGQEFVRPLLMLTGLEYREIRFDDLMGRLEKALDVRYGKRPWSIVYLPDGTVKRSYDPPET